jgi:hypothetical protein
MGPMEMDPELRALCVLLGRISLIRGARPALFVSLGRFRLTPVQPRAASAPMGPMGTALGQLRVRLVWLEPISLTRGVRLALHASLECFRLTPVQPHAACAQMGPLLMGPGRFAQRV